MARKIVWLLIFCMTVLLSASCGRGSPQIASAGETSGDKVEAEIINPTENDPVISNEDDLHIEDGLFQAAGCAEMMRLIISDENTAVIDNNGVIMTADGTVILKYERDDLDEYAVPESVKYIAEHAFQNNTLKKVTFNNGLLYIGYNAFAGCDLLEDIYLPDSIIELADGAFSGCQRAVDGYIPDNIIIGSDTFASVPFYLSKLAEQTSPFEEISRGLVTPSEAIVKSDAVYITEQINIILSYYRNDGSYDDDAAGRVRNALGATLPDGAAIPYDFDFSELSYKDNGWGGMGIRDIQISLLLDGGYVMIMEAYLYAPADYLYWREAKWRIESVYFMEKETDTSGDCGWTATFEKNTGGKYYAIVFRNIEEGNVCRSDHGMVSDSEYNLIFSPDFTKCAVEWLNAGKWYFFVQDLYGAKYSISMNDYVDYLSNYLGDYIQGTIEWIDETHLYARNVNGLFIFDINDSAYPEYVSSDPSGNADSISLDNPQS